MQSQRLKKLIPPPPPPPRGEAGAGISGAAAATAGAGAEAVGSGQKAALPPKAVVFEVQRAHYIAKSITYTVSDAAKSFCLTVKEVKELPCRRVSVCVCAGGHFHFFCVSINVFRVWTECIGAGKGRGGMCYRLIEF